MNLNNLKDIDDRINDLDRALTEASRERALVFAMITLKRARERLASLAIDGENDAWIEEIDTAVTELDIHWGE